MFSSSRKKIVISIAGSLVVLLAVTLAAIYLTNYYIRRRQNEEALKTYVQRYSLEIQPEQGTEGGYEINDGQVLHPDRKDDISDPRGQKDRNEQALRLSTFYAVAFGPSGDVLSVNNGGNGMRSEEKLIETASSILGSGKQTGTEGELLFRVDRRDGYTLVAMIDGTLSDNSQKDLMIQMLIIGAVSLAVLFAVSIFLARGIVKPLEENDAKQKRFISDAGHELKTPIAVISANTELLKREIGDNEWLTNIDYENERMSALVQQLLGLSRAENAMQANETIDLSSLVSGEALPLESLAFEKGKNIESVIAPELTVRGNSSGLRQLVSILLDNALEHGTGNKIELVLSKAKHSAVLTVANEAPELSEAQLSSLFDRFYRVDDARNGQDAHYGLGLSIAKAVTQAHGGTIGAEYKDGKAVFRITLPLAKN